MSSMNAHTQASVKVAAKSDGVKLGAPAGLDQLLLQMLLERCRFSPAGVSVLAALYQA